MIFEEKKIDLKNGTTAILKSPCVADAEKMLRFIKKACGETDYLLRYPEEWTIGTAQATEQEKDWIDRLRTSPDSMDITCYVNGEVVGNCEIAFKSGMKQSHRATIAIAILKDFWSLGIGSYMFEELITVAQERETEIMELSFIEGNERAQKLYEKFGFRIVAEIPNAIKLKDGARLHEFYMQKYLK